MAVTGGLELPIPRCAFVGTLGTQPSSWMDTTPLSLLFWLQSSNDMELRTQTLHALVPLIEKKKKEKKRKKEEDHHHGSRFSPIPITSPCF